MILWLSFFPCRLPAAMTRRSLMKWSWSALRSSVLVDALFVTAAGETGKTVQGRQTEEHSTTSCNIFPSSLPDSASASPMPISSTTLVSAGFPAYCPIFKLNDIPLPSAQPRNLKVYSGGKRRWLRCSFECSIYLFLELVFVLHHITSVFSKALIIYWNEKGFFFPCWFVATVKTNLLWLTSHKRTHSRSFPEVCVRMYEYVNLWEKAHFHKNIMNVKREWIVFPY